MIALCVLIFMFASNKYGWNYFIPSNDDNKQFIVVLFAAASTIFSITLAALAIILSFSASNFMTFLKKNGKLGSILFPFWLGNGAYLIVLLLSTAYLLLNPARFVFLNRQLFPIISSLFVYSVLSTFYLLSTVIRFGYFTNVVNNPEQKL